MKKNEKLYRKWLEEQKTNGVKSVTYSTTDGDVSSEEFFAEANAMNATETVEVTDYTENFPLYYLLEPLVGVAVDKAIAAGRAEELKFNDATTKK